MFVSTEDVFRGFYDSFLSFCGSFKVAGYESVEVADALALIFATIPSYYMLGFCYFLLDVFNPSFAEKRRIQPKPNSPRSVSDMLSCFGSVLFANVFVLIPTAILFVAPLNRYFGIQVKGPFPEWTVMVVQIVFFALVNDFIFYWLHRLMHSKQLYFLHKQHHVHKAPFAWSSEFCSIPELLIVDVLPILIGPWLLGAHFLTFLIWSLIRTLYTMEIHSGYDFWFWRLIPFYGGAPMHDAHHERFDGNYSDCFIFWDVICGTKLENKKLS